MSEAPFILIAAGPTHEPIDPVRYLANRSSGRLGLALSAASAAAGCRTRLLLGPAPAAPAKGVAVDRFESTADLQRLLAEWFPRADILIMAAAVADFRPVAVAAEKLRRAAEGHALRLEPTPDLVAACARSSRPDQRVIGFALGDGSEPVQAARRKLAAKGLDAVVANPLATMGSEDIEATICTAGGGCWSPGHMSKANFATWLIDQLISGQLWDVAAAAAPSPAP
ncbi:MAG: phosphopantothenoylcysteine decarboxylase [Phycisphaerae bacterium]|nr:phosphopantothenoylcysteine decarboxylase [Phycisphaerae bacterium]